MVVDCLLPGQIRQLGGKVTYVTARRAVKTAARDCEIRGGEYVSLDRANYATALKVWLPLAEQGDPAAQTYVGEIYEQGLGIQPDPAAAATWYRKAADKGYSRAALNLGTLYEQGRGVPRDPAQALNWYRRASGLPPAASFELTSTASTTEVQQLRAEVGQLRQELDAKGQELTRLQGELDGARKTLEGRRGEADAERGSVAQLRQELDANRQRENAGRGRITELEKTLTEREARLAKADRELAAARSALAAAQQQSKSADVSRLAAETAQLQTQTEGDRGQVAGLRAQLAESRKDAGTQTARVAELERSVAEREASLAAKNKEADALRATVARLEGETKDQRERLDRLREQSGAGPVIQILQPELRTMRDGKNVRALVATAERTVVVGRVTSEAELLTLTVNDRAEKLLANNVFRADVALPQPEQPVRIVAIDKQGRRSTLEFVVARSAPTPPPITGGTGSRVGLPKSAGSASFGTYYALVIGNNDYRQLRKLKTAVADAREVAPRPGKGLRLPREAADQRIAVRHPGRAQRPAGEAHREGQSPHLLRRARRARRAQPARSLAPGGRRAKQHDQLDLQRRDHRRAQRRERAAAARRRRLLLLRHDDPLVAGAAGGRRERHRAAEAALVHGPAALTHGAHLRWHRAGHRQCGGRALGLRPGLPGRPARQRGCDAGSRVVR